MHIGISDLFFRSSHFPPEERAANHFSSTRKESSVRQYIQSNAEFSSLVL